MADIEFLIEKVKKGDQKAFKKLFDLNVAKLYRFLAQFSRDHDIIEEWVQRAFIKAYYRINQYEGRSKFSTWLFTIAINEMRSDSRIVREKKTVSINELENFDLTEDAENFEWKYDMKKFLALLDDEKKTIFILFEVEGYSHDEIAEMLGISSAKSRTSLCRAKKVIKEKSKLFGVSYD